MIYFYIQTPIPTPPRILIVIHPTITRYNLSAPVYVSRILSPQTSQSESLHQYKATPHNTDPFEAAKL